MTTEQLQGAIGCFILALGFAFPAEFRILHGLALDPGAFMRVAGGAILADYALHTILEARESRRR